MDFEIFGQQPRKTTEPRRETLRLGKGGRTLVLNPCRVLGNTLGPLSCQKGLAIVLGHLSNIVLRTLLHAHGLLAAVHHINSGNKCTCC